MSEDRYSRQEFENDQRGPQNGGIGGPYDTRLKAELEASNRVVTDGLMADVDKLARHLLREHPDECGRDHGEGPEGAVDTALRLLKRYKGAANRLHLMEDTVPRGAVTPLELALLFHEAYERLAPDFGYETRTETRVFDPESKNGKLMVAVCGELLKSAERRIREEHRRRAEGAELLAERGAMLTHASAEVIRLLDSLIGTVVTRVMPPGDDDVFAAAVRHLRQSRPEWGTEDAMLFAAGAFWMRGIGPDEERNTTPPGAGR